MRTKTLLIAAAALATAVTSSQAQSTVYSQNVVGYINLVCTNAHFAMVGNQLDTGSNTINNVLQGSGAVSANTELLLWSGTGYIPLTYYDCSQATAAGGWYLGSAPYGSTNFWKVGQGGFLFNTSGGNITLPTVGQVTQGTNVYTINAGFNFLALPEPLAGQALDSTNVNLPAVSSQDECLLWSGTGFIPLTYYDCAQATGHGGWYLGSTWEDTNSALWANAGGGFFIDHVGAPEMWTNTFEVQ